MKELRYIQLVDAECGICGAGFTSDNGLEIHHIDRDRDNNPPSNLLIICHDCHLHIHHPDARKAKGTVEWRREQMIKLFSKGYSFSEIGRILNISRQAVYQFYHRYIKQKRMKPIRGIKQ